MDSPRHAPKAFPDPPPAGPLPARPSRPLPAEPCAERGDAPLAIYYEHPDWFRPLLAELDRRGVPYTKLHAARHTFDPGAPSIPHRVVLNRMSPSAWLRDGADRVFYTSQYLLHLRRLGVRVINGIEAWTTEISKAAQLTLLARLGLPFPSTRAVHDPAAAAAAGAALRFPVIVKPNVGGSGAGVARFDTHEALERAARQGELEFGIDGTALVQEYIPAREQGIVRVEILDGRFLYAIRIRAPDGSFDLCPADICRNTDGRPLARSACPTDAPTNDLMVESFEPPREVRTTVERIARAAGIEVGGVEYLVDERDGSLKYYDVNALSNFVADAPNVVGFDPFERLADWLEAELARARTIEEVA